jgi:hypothetical protein
MQPRPRVARKLLVASFGVATMSYVASCGSTTTTATGDGGAQDGPAQDALAQDGKQPDVIDDFPVANLVAPDTGFQDTIDDFPVANLVAQPDASDSSSG